MSNQPHNFVENNSSLPAVIPSVSLVLVRTNSALGLLHDVVQESSADYWYKRGIADVIDEKWARGAYAFSRCLKLNAMHWNSSLQLAMALARQQLLFEAATVMLDFHDKFVEEWPYFMCKLEQSKLIEFENDLEIYVSNNSINYEILFMRAMICDVRNDHHKLSDIQEDIELLYKEKVQESALWHWFVGYGDYRLQCYESALKYFDAAIKLNFSGKFIYSCRAITKGELNDYAGALVDFEIGVKEPKYNAEYYDRRAGFKSRFGDYVGALIDYDSAIGMDENSLKLHLERGKIKFEKLKDYSGALHDYEQVIVLSDEQKWEYYLRRAEIKEKLSQYSSSLIDYDYAIHLLPHKSEFAYARRAFVKDKLHDTSGATSDRDVVRLIQEKDERNSAYDRHRTWQA